MSQNAGADKVSSTVLKRESRLLSCRLTNEELIARGQSLAEAIENISTEEAQQESLKREMKARLAGLEAQRSHLASVVSRRAEMREVSVEVALFEDAGVVHTIRMDTGEVVHSRPMTDDERQRSLALES